MRILLLLILPATLTTILILINSCTFFQINNLTFIIIIIIDIMYYFIKQIDSFYKNDRCFRLDLKINKNQINQSGLIELSIGGFLY